MQVSLESGARKQIDGYAISVYIMWTSDEIVVEIDVVEHTETVIATTPAGVISMMAGVSIIDRVLRLDGVHIGGLKPGALGRAGLNAIGRKLLELADVDEI